MKRLGKLVEQVTLRHTKAYRPVNRHLPVSSLKRLVEAKEETGVFLVVLFRSVVPQRPYTAGGAAIEEPKPGLTQQQLKRVMDFVQAHLSQDLSLEILAQQIGFSPYHFARLFRQTTGESPHQLVLRQRIERAQRLLQERDVPLAHVAVKSGFANQSHLTQAFKRHLGLTPQAYRQECSH